jgi:acetyltransferase-like isoleucine patch superfamily enzyme
MLIISETAKISEQADIEDSVRGTRIVQKGFAPSRGGITIHDDVWIGVGTVILDGAVVGEGCVVGAGSLVKGSLEPYSIYAANPLAKIGERK